MASSAAPVEFSRLQALNFEALQATNQGRHLDASEAYAAVGDLLAAQRPPAGHAIVIARIRWLAEALSVNLACFSIEHNVFRTRAYDLLDMIETLVLGPGGPRDVSRRALRAIVSVYMFCVSVAAAHRI